MKTFLVNNENFSAHKFFTNVEVHRKNLKSNVLNGKEFLIFFLVRHFDDFLGFKEIDFYSFKSKIKANPSQSVQAIHQMNLDSKKSIYFLYRQIKKEENSSSEMTVKCGIA